MRKITIVLVFLVTLLLAAGTASYLAGEVRHLGHLAGGFAASQATLLEINMNGWARAQSGPQSAETLTEKLRRASLLAFGESPPEIKTWADGGNIFAYASFVSGAYAVEANAQNISQYGTEEKYGGTYLVLTISTTVPGYSIEALESTLHTFFESLGLRPTVTTCFVGVLAGRLSPAEAALVVARVLGALEAEAYEFYSDGQSVNLVGHSRKLPSGVTIADRPINLSLMLRFDPENNRTHLWLATPTLSL